MKKFALLILGFFLGLMAMYFYVHNDTNLNEMASTTTPNGIIKPAIIKSLTQAYNSRYDTINNTIFKGVPGGDNRSSWYALEDLENYLALAKQQAEDLGYTMDGVRLYLGAQPMADDAPGYTTLLFVPTGQKITSQGSLVNISLQGGGGSPDIPDGNGLDKGGNGHPPSANYPQ